MLYERQIAVELYIVRKIMVFEDKSTANQITIARQYAKETNVQERTAAIAAQFPSGEMSESISWLSLKVSWLRFARQRRSD